MEIGIPLFRHSHSTERNRAYISIHARLEVLESGRGLDSDISPFFWTLTWTQKWWYQMDSDFDCTLLMSDLLSSDPCAFDVLNQQSCHVGGPRDHYMHSNIFVDPSSEYHAKTPKYTTMYSRCTWWQRVYLRQGGYVFIWFACLLAGLGKKLLNRFSQN